MAIKIGGTTVIDDSRNITNNIGTIPASKISGSIPIGNLSTATTQAESDSSAKIATTAYVTNKITTLIGGAPSTLNDLNELAAAINDDANYNSTLTTALATKLPLAGGTLTGDLSFGDNDKAIFGAGSDLQIYHDGNNSLIAEVGTGNLHITAQDLRLQSANNQDTIKCIQNGAVTIYYDNAAKLATTSTGITVTGGVRADAMYLGDGEFFHAGNSGDLKLGHISNESIIRSHNLPLNIDGNSITFRGYSPYIRHMHIAQTGDISFYDDTGANANFFWDASADSLGIGTSAPATALHVRGTASTAGANRSVVTLTDDTAMGINVGSGVAFRGLYTSAGAEANYGGIFAGKSNANSGNANGYLSLSYSASGALTEGMRIDSSGNVLVGTTDNDASTTSSNSGVNIREVGQIATATDGTVGAIFNRLTSDGDIALFRKAGTTVGSIGAHTGDLYIGTGDTALRFFDASDFIYPVSASTGTSRDNAIDLGYSTGRFKNLYLSGSIANPSGDLTVDVSGNITLDADGGSVFFKDAGTEFFKIRNTGSDVQIYSARSDADMKFEGVDGGVGITALKLDMSDAGTAIFNNKVGIGTSSPSYKLSVSGNIGLTDGTSTATHTLVGGNYYIQNAGAYSTIFQTNNAERMRITSSGNVGIGTSSPTEKLHIKSGGNAYKMLILESESGDAGLLLQGQGGNQFSIQQNSNQRGLFFYDRTAGTERMRIDSSGNVGIGTTSPNAGFEVLKSGGGKIRISETTAKYVEIIGYAEGSANGSTMAFHTNQAGTSTSTERMRINSSGNVGIGTSSPAFPLDVSTNSSTTNDAVVVSRLSANTTGTAANNFGAALNFSAEDASGSLRDLATINGIYTNATSRSSAITFKTRANLGALTERMRIDSSGNLLVGKTSTSFGVAGVRVRGDTVGIIEATSANNMLVLNRLTSDGPMASFYKDGTAVGSIGVAQSGDRTYFSGGSYGVASDTSEATIMPCGTTGTGNDGVVSLGKSDARFKDGHFSGNLYGDGSNLTGVGGSTAYGAVGTYTVGASTTNAGTVGTNRGATVAGSSIHTSGAAGAGTMTPFETTSSNSSFRRSAGFSGTWRNMAGDARQGAGNYPGSLYVRIS